MVEPSAPWVEPVTDRRATLTVWVESGEEWTYSFVGLVGRTEVGQDDVVCGCALCVVRCALGWLLLVAEGRAEREVVCNMQC